MRQSWESMEASGGRHNTRRPCGPGDWPLRTSVAWTGAGDNNKKKRRSSQCSSSPLFSLHKRSGRCCRGPTVTPAESDARSAAAFSLFLRSERRPAGREHDLKPLSGGVCFPCPCSPTAAAAADRTASFPLCLTNICLLVNTVAAARTPSGALMHPFQWCNGERSFFLLLLSLCGDLKKKKN